MVEILPNIIPNPFNTIYDVTKDTPIDQVPPEYFQSKQRIKDEKTEIEKLQQAIQEFSLNPDNEELLIQEAHKTISKLDDHIIKIVFHVGLSTYFKPLNLGLKAGSGTGKSYSTVETLKFLPKEDIEEIGSYSPKVISHQNGVCKAKDGTILDPKLLPKKPNKKDYGDLIEYESDKKAYETALEKYEEDMKECYYEVDLRNKVLVFLESVNLETFKMFKTTMSHDGEYIDHKYVDDRGKVHITRLLGAPAMIFNSVDSSYIEEFATRTLSATPSDRTEKIEESMDISNKKSAYPWIYKGTQFNQKVIQEYVRLIKKYVLQGRIKVAIPFLGIKEAFSKTQVRDMRDFNKFLELLPSYTIFKLFQRPIVMIDGQRYLLPTIEDAVNAKEAYDQILETTKTSTDYRVIDFYYTVVAKTNGLTAEDLTDLYNKGKKRQLTVKRIREWLQRLEDLDYVDVREGESRNDRGFVDKRFNAYYPMKKNAPNTAILEIGIDLYSILKKGFEEWIKNAPIQTDVPPIILQTDGTAQTITQEEIVELIINKKMCSNISGILSNLNIDSNKENKPESTPIDETAAIRTFFYNKIPRKPGVHCNAIDSGGFECTFEAEYDLNGNLYCETHFHEQRKVNEDNGFAVKQKEENV